MDEVDIAQAAMELEERMTPPRPAYVLPPGKPGDCETCGEWTGRLIEGMCAPCRDQYARVQL